MAGSENSQDDQRRARRERRGKARRRVRNQRLIVLVAVPAAVIATLAGLSFGSGVDDQESGSRANLDQPAEAESEIPATLKQRAEAARRLRQERAIDRVLRYTTFITHGAGRKREVALTFDDGPGTSTARILNILRRTGAPATFFVVGSEIPGNEKILRRIDREGHAIGGHTQNHPAMGSLDPADQRQEIALQDKAFERAGVEPQRIFRPPYRSYNRATFGLLRDRRELMVLWSIDTEDYTNPGAEKIARRVLDSVKPGSIVLMHDAGGDRQETVRALPDIIKGLRKRKLRPVTVPQLIVDDPPARGERYPEGI